MKFSAAIVASTVALSGSASAFGGFQCSAFNGNSRFALQPVSTHSRGALSMSLADLENKLFANPASSKVIKESNPSKPVEKKDSTPSPKVEKPTPKATVKPTPTPKPPTTPKVEAKPLEKAVSPKVIEKPKDISPKVIEKPKGVSPPEAKATPKRVQVSKAPAVSVEPANVSLGVALGAAPLIALPLLALAAGRGALTSTVARRGQIQREIEAIETQKKAKVNAQADAGGIAKALVFLGGAGASLALIVAAPFASIQEVSNKVEASKVAKPVVTKILQSKKAAVVKTVERTPASPATGGIATRSFVRKAAADAKPAESKENAAKATAEKLKAVKEAEATEKLAKTLLEKGEKDLATKEAAAKAAEAKVVASKTPASKEKATAIAIAKDEVALAAEARQKDLKKAETTASADLQIKEKAAVDAELKEQAAKKKEAVASAEAAAKEKATAETATKALLQEKAAAEAAAKEKAAAETATKALLQEKVAAEAAVKAAKEVTAPAPVEPVSSAIPTSEKASGLGVVSGMAQGGRVLPAETLDLSALDFLKKK